MSTCHVTQIYNSYGEDHTFWRKILIIAGIRFLCCLSVSLSVGIPSDSRMEAMQAAILLMPDPNREALQTLLLFLNEVAANCETNQVRFH